MTKQAQRSRFTRMVRHALQPGAAAAMAALAGCARTTIDTVDRSRTEGERILQPPPDPVAPAGIAGAPAPDASDWPDAAGVPDTAVATIEPAASVVPAPVEAEATAEAPPLDEQNARPTSEALLVDAKIGDVSGKPIFASDFLEPMAARLRAEAAKMNRREWLIFAQKEIHARLVSTVQDVLLQEEARSRLTPEKKQGLLHFISMASEEARSSALGSTELAKEKIFDERGMTEQEYLRWKEQRLLISDLLWPIVRRVHVSSADIQRYYAQNKDVFIPPATAHFRLVRVRNADAEDVKTIVDALASGTPFEEVAALDANRYKSAEGGEMEPAEFVGDYAEAELLRVKPLNEAARTLTPGTWTGPIAVSDSETAWLALDRVERTALSLYEAQLAIDRALRQRYEEEELGKYIERLRGPVDMRAESDIVAELLAIALDRYGPPPTR